MVRPRSPPRRVWRSHPVRSGCPSFRASTRILRPMEIGVITWNLFHGRDSPPNPALFTWRSRLTGRPERDATHLQLNRDLLDDFAGLLVGWSWDIALLQECPPRWSTALAAACGASAHRALTS